MPEEREAIWRAAEASIVAGDLTALEQLLTEHRSALRGFYGLPSNYGPGDARPLMARAHEFASWEDFAAFTATLRDPASAIAVFEAAVDAVVGGDAAGLERLLREHPDLVRTRSARKHHSTLLHYVAANGVEGYHQETPKNAVEVAGVLLEAGAEPDALADMYGGQYTTMSMLVSSCHPARSATTGPTSCSKPSRSPATPRT